MKAIAVAAALLLVLSMTASAVSTSSAPVPKGSLGPSPAPATAEGREGGETVLDAVPIPLLPFSDTGSTVGHVNDYDAACPYAGSTAPDVVYKYTPSSNWMYLTVDLCASEYDTKIYIFEDAVNNVVACNDDAGCGYSGWQSKIYRALLWGGHTYYIVIDGYGDAAGTYAMTVFENTCSVPCPPGALLEQEPPCHDGYVDDWNSGCQHDPVLFQDIAPGAPGETITLCGEGGTYLYNGMSYRDTDWFQLTFTEPKTITACCTADFPLLLFLIYDGGCAAPQMDYALANPCDEACLTRQCGPGVAWLWVGSSAFNGVPCGSDYVLTIDGYDAPSPVEGRSWGAVKAMYR